MGMVLDVLASFGHDVDKAAAHLLDLLTTNASPPPPAARHALIPHALAASRPHLMLSDVISLGGSASSYAPSPTSDSGSAFSGAAATPGFDLSQFQDPTTDPDAAMQLLTAAKGLDGPRPVWVPTPGLPVAVAAAIRAGGRLPLPPGGSPPLTSQLRSPPSSNSGGSGAGSSSCSEAGDWSWMHEDLASMETEADREERVDHLAYLFPTMARAELGGLLHGLGGNVDATVQTILKEKVRAPAGGLGGAGAWACSQPIRVAVICSGCSDLLCSRSRLQGSAGFARPRCVS